MPDRNGPIRHAMRAIAGGESPRDLQIRHAARVARCVGRGPAAPLLRDDAALIAIHYAGINLTDTDGLTAKAE